MIGTGDTRCSTRQRVRRAAVRRCRVPARASRTSARRRSSSATALGAPATTSPTSSASGCRRSTRSTSSSRRSRRRSRPATCARVSAAARSASRKSGRRSPTAPTPSCDNCSTLASSTSYIFPSPRRRVVVVLLTCSGCSPVAWCCRACLSRSLFTLWTLVHSTLTELQFVNGSSRSPEWTVPLHVWHGVYTLLLAVQPVVWTQPVRLQNRLGKICKWAQSSGAWVWTVDDVARSIEFIKRILVYLFIFTIGWGMTKIRSTTKNLLYSIYLFIIWIFKTFHPAGCTTDFI